MMTKPRFMDFARTPVRRVVGTSAGPLSVPAQRVIVTQDTVAYESLFTDLTTTGGTRTTVFPGTFASLYQVGRRH